MKVSEVIQLIGAGYTKEEIAALEAGEPINPEPDHQDPQPDPPAPATVAAPDPAAAQSNEELISAIKTLTAAVQHNNKINTPQPDSIVPEDVQKQADEILTKFLNT